MGYLRRLVKNTIKHYQTRGFRGIVSKIPDHTTYLLKRLIYPDLDYRRWLKRNEDILLDSYLSDTKIDYKPLISVLTPLYNVPEEYFQKCVNSVLAQTYENWELCVHNDSSSKYLENIDYVKRLSEENQKVKFSSSDKNENLALALNHCLKLATGKYFIILDNDDELHPRALEMLVRKINSNRDLRYIYTDEDNMEMNGKRVTPHFKPDWSPNYTLSTMYTTHISMFETELVRKIGGIRKGYEGSQDYDLVLRYTEEINDDQVGHVPLVLYHWRKIPGSTAVVYEAKSGARNAAMKALEDTINRRDLNAVLEDGLTTSSFRMKYRINGDPKVSIIIPTYNQKKVLEKCINSIYEKTEYKNYEILVVDNNSDDSETLEYLDKIRSDSKVDVLKYPKQYNFSAINNFAVKEAEGEYVLLLNNDIEVINKGWLTSMLELAQLDSIGAVGSMLLFPNNTYQHAGVVLGVGEVAGHSFKKLEKSNAGHLGQAHIIRDVSAVTAACLMVSKKKYNEVGGLNEDLRIAFNDIDFCLKLSEKGYTNLYTPFSQLYHYESLSRLDDMDPRRQEEYEQEVKHMKKRWGKKLEYDPYYSPNLTRRYEDYSLELDIVKRSYE